MAKWPTTNSLPPFTGPSKIGPPNTGSGKTGIGTLTGSPGPYYPSPIPKAIKVGNHVIDEPMLDDLLSLLDAVTDLPDDNELKRLFVAHKVTKRITR